MNSSNNERILLFAIMDFLTKKNSSSKNNMFILNIDLWNCTMNLVLMIIQNRGSDNAWKKFLLSLSHFDVLVKHAQDQTLDGTSITLFKIRELVKEAIKFECQMTK